LYAYGRDGRVYFGGDMTISSTAVADAVVMGSGFPTAGGGGDCGDDVKFSSSCGSCRR
jgi:hypothetical protein